LDSGFELKSITIQLDLQLTFQQARSQRGAIAPHNSESCTKNFQVIQAFYV